MPIPFYRRMMIWLVADAMMVYVRRSNIKKFPTTTLDVWVRVLTIVDTTISNSIYERFID